MCISLAGLANSKSSSGADATQIEVQIATVRDGGALTQSVRVMIGVQAFAD